MEIIKPDHSEPQWVKCRSCSGEVSKIFDDGCCYECHRSNEQRQRNQASLVDRIETAIGPHGASEFTLSNFRSTAGSLPAFQAAQKYDPKTSDLFLFGTVGTGKTHLAGALFQKFVREGKTAIWSSPRDINRQFRLQKPEIEGARLDEFSSCDLLVVDDLGIGKDTEFTLAILCEILDKRFSRYRHGLIFTSNLSLDQLAQKFGEDRLTSRIAGCCSVFEIKDRDHRLDGTK